MNDQMRATALFGKAIMLRVELMAIKSESEFHGWCQGRVAMPNEDRKQSVEKKSADLKLVFVWCQWEELNLRPKAYESSALPLSYTGHRKRSYILRTFRALSNLNRKPKPVDEPEQRCSTTDGHGWTRMPIP